MDPRPQRHRPAPGGSAERPGLPGWIRRNHWLLLRLTLVLVLTLLASVVAVNLLYTLDDSPTQITAEQVNEGRLPAGLEEGDFVEIRGTPEFGEGSGEPRVGLVSRYEVSYYYFELEETGDGLLIQAAQTPPDLEDSSTRTYRGRLTTVGGVIFYNTTQEGLQAAKLPYADSIPVVETGEKPQDYQRILPAYLTILGLWALSVTWLLWRRNRPFA